MTVKKRLGRMLRGKSVGLWGLLLYHRVRKLVLSRLPGEAFAQYVYRRATGGSLDLEKPSTFDEKLWWLKLYYRDPLMIECSDKVTVRDYVSRHGYGHTLNEMYGAWQSPRAIPWEQLPSRFYLKVSNASAANIRVEDKRSVDVSAVERRLKLLLRSDHASISREWNYDSESLILAEKTIDAPVGGLIDYRFLCSYGTCYGVFVDVDTADDSGRHRDDARRNVYDRDFNLLDVRVTRPRIEDRVMAKPPVFEAMREMAEALSAPFPFCRVDLYEVGGAIVFGEMTFFHAGGCNKIEPAEFAVEMGSWIDLARVAKNA